MKKKFFKILSFHPFFSKEKLLQEEVSLEEIGLMSTDIIYRIYKRRSALSDLIGKELLASINSFPEKQILLTRVEYKSEKYIALTNDSMTKLIGIIPEKDKIFE